MRVINKPTEMAQQIRNSSFISGNVEMVDLHGLGRLQMECGRLSLC